MKGISGIYHFGFQNIEERTIGKMNSAISNSGSSDILISKNIGIGKVDSESKNSEQGFTYSPLKDIAVALCGTLYNREELLSKLSDYQFKDFSDEEILIAGFKKWSVDLPKFLEGKFTFAILNIPESELFIARDKMGEQPLYYYQDAEKLIFSTKMKGVIASEMFEPIFAKDRLPEYFRFGTITGENTFYRNLKYFPAANSAFLTSYIFNFEEYWKPDLKNYSSDNYETALKKTKDLVFSAVEKSIKNTDFAVFLSGGIDSSVTTAVASQISLSPVQTFNISFEEKEFSEAHYAKIISNKFGTKHTEIKLKAELFLEEIENILSAYDFPSFDGPNTYIVSQAVSKFGIPTAISGLGGDEIFCGYPVFNQLQPAMRKAQLIPSFAKNLLIKYLEKSPDMRKIKTIELLSYKKLELWDAYGIFRSLLGKEDCKNLASGYRTIVNPDKHFKGSKNLMSEISMAEFYYYMQPILLRDTAQMSDIHNLDVRSPLIDSQLIEYVLSLSDSHKIIPKKPKSLLLNSLGELIPKEIYDRKKMGFVLPWEKWMKNELSHYVQNAIIGAGQKGFISQKEWDKAYNEFLKGNKSYNWNIFWGLVVLDRVTSI